MDTLDSQERCGIYGVASNEGDLSPTSSHSSGSDELDLLGFECGDGDGGRLLWGSEPSSDIWANTAAKSSVEQLAILTVSRLG
jgi:hypothetical protein